MTAADAEFGAIEDTAPAAGWFVNREVISGVDCAVLVRRVERHNRASESVHSDTDLDIRVTESLEKRGVSCDDVFRPKSPMGVQTGRAGTAGQRARCGSASAGPAAGGFGDLATVRAMGTGVDVAVIGFDTEFTYRDDRSRRIDSYQFCVADPDDPRMRVDVVLLPLVDGRVAAEDALAVVVRESGLWRAAGLPDPRGVARRDFWVTGDYAKSVESLYARCKLPLVLAGHYLPADLTAFARPPRRRGGERYDDILRRVTSASGGLVSLKPIRMSARTGSGSSQRWLPMSITVRDTMGQSAPGAKSLAVLGEVCGVPKLDVGDAIETMTALRRDRLVDFLEYGVNDSAIVVEYLAALWGDSVEPPVTLSGGGARALRDGVKRYMGLRDNAEFMARFQGLIRVGEGEDASDDGLSYYTVRSLTPVDGDANQAHSAFKKAFHGGWNTSQRIGYFPVPTFDHDIQSAYPTSMASVVDVDFEAGCIESVVKDRALTLDDFPLGPVTPLVAYVSWVFPEDVEPCLPVRVGQSIVYPRRSAGAGAAQGEGMDGVDFDSFQGAWCCGPEIYLALRLGASVIAQIGYVMRVLDDPGDEGPSRSLRSAVRQMVVDRVDAKGRWGKGSLPEQMVKVATNSCYGKLAQDVSERNGWNAWVEEMESIGGSAVTSPYHAAMITSLVRALLLGMANELSMISTTTDGFITEVENIENFDCFGLSDIFRDARRALSGDSTVWEVKHRQDDLVNLTTRGNVSLSEGGVLAKAGLKTPRGIARGSIEERKWFRGKALSREGKVVNPYTAFPSFRELSRSEDRVDFGPVERAPEVSLDFDFKRRPLMETLRVDVVDGREIAGFDTAPWDDVVEYTRARDIARHIAAVRPGTTGDDRPTGCLRTEKEWRTWERRFASSVGRRVRTAEATLLTEIVAAHKEGLVSVPVLASRVSVDQKLAWLSSLGYGEFTRAQWDHMSKKDRRRKVLRDVDWSLLADVIERLPEW